MLRECLLLVVENLGKNIVVISFPLSDCLLFFSHLVPLLFSHQGYPRLSSLVSFPVYVIHKLLICYIWFLWFSGLFMEEVYNDQRDFAICSLIFFEFPFRSH